MAQYSANFNQAKVLVLGDVMLDRYWFGATNRISPEAPVPVVRVQNNEERAGGAANVAMNIASLNVPVQILGLIGQDETGSAFNEFITASKNSIVILWHWILIQRLRNYVFYLAISNYFVWISKKISKT
ncbi:MAG: PfkB family carbohydrate kinase [Haemophilus parainfluenzae]